MIRKNRFHNNDNNTHGIIIMVRVIRNNDHDQHCSTTLSPLIPTPLLMAMFHTLGVLLIVGFTNTPQHNTTVIY